MAQNNGNASAYGYTKTSLPRLTRTVSGEFTLDDKRFSERLPPLKNDMKLKSKPKAVERGSRTQATPFKEKPFFRRVSDTIANNYSPQAKTLTASLVYSATRFVPTVEERFMQAGGRLYSSDTVMALQTSPRSRYMHTAPVLRPLVSQQQTSDWRLELSAGRPTHHLALGSLLENRSVAKRLKLARKGEYREHDAETQACLQVQFLPWYTATTGLSRPPTPEPRSLQRYYQMAESAVESSEVHTLPDWQAEKVIKQLGTLPRDQPQCTNVTLSEVMQEYNRAMKLAVLNYILRDPEEQQRLNISVHIDSSDRSAGRHTFPWHNRCVLAATHLKTAMFTYHPVMLAVQYHFQKNYAQFRLVDFEQLEAAIPLTIDEFCDAIREHTKRARALLNTKWLTECSLIANEKKDLIELWVAHEQPVDRSNNMDVFFNTLAQLMSTHLRYLTEATLVDFVALFEQYAEINAYSGGYDMHSGLALPTQAHVIRLFLDQDMEQSEAPCFAPTFQQLAAKLQSAVDTIVQSCGDLQRLESRLFQPIDTVVIGTIRNVQLDEQLVLESKQRITAVLARNQPGPEHYQSVYEPYGSLLQRAAANRIHQFVTNSNNKLADYAREIEEQKRMRGEVASMPVDVPMQLFLLDCSPLNGWLQQRASDFAHTLVEQTVQASRRWNRQICLHFDSIVNKITAQLDSTAQLVELQRYVDSLAVTDLAVLREQLDTAANNVLFLMEYAHLPNEDVSLNHVTFNWPSRIGPIMQNAEAKLVRERDNAVQRLADSVKHFGVRLSELQKQVKDLANRHQLSEAEQYVEEVEEINRRLQDCREEKRRIGQEELLLDSETRSDWPQLTEIQAAKEPFEKLWQGAVKFQKAYDSWLNGPLLDLNADEVEEDVQQFWRTAYRLIRYFSQGDMRNPLRVAVSIKTKLDKFKLNLPLLVTLSRPGLKQRHWNTMSQTVGFNITPSADTKFTDLLALGLEKHLDALSAVAATASKEFALEKALDKMKQDWNSVHLNMVPYKHTGVQVLAGVDEVQVLLDDHLLKTMTMKGSPHVHVLEYEVNQWDVMLHRMKDTLDCWLAVQSDWTYLQQIFSSAEIRAQMPEKGKVFLEVDANWRSVTGEAARRSSALQTLANQQLLDSLMQNRVQLELVHKALKEYLDKKRLLFPRFFFLSNDELIEILSETKEPQRVQPYVKKCFQGIYRLVFDAQSYVVGMRSEQDEQVAFLHSVCPAEANGLVEQWLLQVEVAMRHSLSEVHHRAVQQLEALARRKWVTLWPQQVCLAASAVRFTAETTLAIQTNSLADYHARCQQQVDELVQSVRDDAATRKTQRLLLQTLLTRDLHYLDVVRTLRERGVSSANDFDWVGQLRYYYDEETRGLRVRMVSTELAYGFEYVGNQESLVMTPLTDRCLRTMMAAAQLHLGSCPEGPAGTGKTETGKELARALATQCLVFNCSEALDYVAMGRFLKGVALTGAFCVFDEFNRIELEVLSVIAQQLQQLQRGLAQDVPTFWFEGSVINAKPCSIVVTMNAQYAGRVALPDNLKALLRPVAMVTPDYARIAELTLYASGFTRARQLAAKIVCTYRICGDQLSAQPHYDYGMRAIKATLGAALQLRARYKSTEEDEVILRALLDVNVPRLVAPDMPLFTSILADLFPGREALRADRENFFIQLRAAVNRARLEHVEWFETKVAQLYDVMLVRHGVMLVGEALSAKSSLYKLLADALRSLPELDECGADVTVLFPKALTLDRLYGRYDPDTHDWFDGVLAALFRQQAASITPQRQWTVFDGPVDPVWVESLNTLLDDNKKLCLASGEAIHMNARQTVLFETETLDHASPATVSRCGMVHCSAQALGPQALWRAWLQHSVPCADILSDELRNTLHLATEWLLPPVVHFVASQCSLIENFSAAHLVVNFLRLFAILLEELRLIERPEDEEEFDTVAADQTGSAQNSPQHNLVRKPTEMALNGNADAAMSPQNVMEERQTWIVATLAFSLVNAVGACVDSASRPKFDQFFKTLCETDANALKNARPKDLKVSRSAFFPKKDTVFDYVFLRKPLGGWYQWSVLVSKNDLPSGYLEQSDLFVSTAESERQLYFVNKFVNQQQPLLLVGASGTGKTAVVSNVMRSLAKDKWVQHQLALSAYTKAQQLQDSLFAKLEKRSRGVYGLSGGRRLLLFVDDLNMPEREQFGARPVLELLRQMLDARSVHGEGSEQCQLRDIAVLGAMRPTSSGRAALPARLARHLFTCCVEPLDSNQLRSVFGPPVDQHFRNSEPSLRRIARVLLSATVDLCHQCQRVFLPTPARCHYLFGPRDVGALLRSCLFSMPVSSSASPGNTPGSTPAPAGSPGPDSGPASRLLRLWTHEAYRVLHDRLAEEDEREAFFKLLRSVAEAHFKERFAAVFSDFLAPGERVLTGSALSRLVFRHVPSRDASHMYAEASLDLLVQEVQQGLDDHNAQSNTPVDLVVFTQVAQHVARITRVLSRPGGHCLLVGVGGSGRESLAQLATALAGCDVFRVLVTITYSLEDWRSDIRTLMRRAGLDCRRTVFLFVDHQVNHTAFLEDINCLLNTADIPNLFEREERMQIIDRMQHFAMQEGLQVEQTPVNMYNLFLQRVHQNLHLIITLNPLDDNFRNYIRQFPSLTTCCAIDWFTAWSPEALEKVAVKYLEDIEITSETRDQCVLACKFFQPSCMELAENYFNIVRRRVWVTPISYLEMLRTFRNLLSKKRDKLFAQRIRYSVGLDKLYESENKIEAMRQELQTLTPQLVQTSEETEELIKMIENEKRDLETVKSSVEQEEETAEAKAQRSQLIRDECDESLQQAMPAMEEATNALDTLKPNDIAVVKTLQNPPNGVKLVMEAICILKGVKPQIKADDKGKQVEDYWPAAKRLIGDINFLNSLKEFDKDNIPPPYIKKIRERYINNRDFDPEMIRASSSACEGLCKWVRAVEVYDRVLKVIAPKQADLREAEEQLAVLTRDLQEKRVKLAEVTLRLETKKKMLRTKMAEKVDLEKQIKLCIVKIQRAEKIILGLSDEKTRWSESVKVFASLFDSVVGDVLLSSAVVAYLGPFMPSYRQGCIKKWQEYMRSVGLNVSDNFSLATVFGDPLVIRDWQVHSLPADTNSTENAIVATVSNRWPLMIDPQRQMNRWIKSLEGGNRLAVIQQSDPYYIRVLRNCIQFGNPCLIENVGEKFDPMLEPIFLKQIFKQSGLDYLRVGEDTIPYSQGFRLYITTRLRNPVYQPEISTQLNIICVITTPSGLEEQLTSIVVAHERPDLSSKNSALLLENAKTERQLSEIEDKILEILNTSKGDILADETAIEILQSSKQVARQIEEKRRILAETKREIDEVRSFYKALGQHASELFFAATAMSNVNPLYQFSLQWFSRLFVQSVGKNERKNSVLADRLAVMQKRLTERFYDKVVRALYERDQLVFSVLLWAGLARRQGRLTEVEWEFLLRGNVQDAELTVGTSRNPLQKWLPDRSWAAVCAASMHLDCMKGLPDHMKLQEEEWRRVLDAHELHQITWPEPYETTLSSVQRIILLRCLRPDKVVPALRLVLASQLGEHFLQQPPFNLAESYAESAADTPVCLLLSPGSDPLGAVFQLADQVLLCEGSATGRQKDANPPRSTGVTLTARWTRGSVSTPNATGARKEVFTISLGQGQGTAAERAIHDATANGSWVVLQNCHLAGSWLPQLERICQRLADGAGTEPHQDFRLWLTLFENGSENEGANFPVSILQDSVKTTCQTPVDLKASLLGSYSNETVNSVDFFHGCARPAEFHSLLFSLAFFHALVQERKRAGALGWNVPYQFTDADFRISALQLRFLIDEQKAVPIEALTYLVAECNYGGRVTDERDRRLLKTLMKRFYVEAAYTQKQYNFCADSDAYYVPDDGEHGDYVTFIKNLPLNTPPALLGLHSNATLLVEQNITQSLVDSIYLTVPKLAEDSARGANVQIQEIIDSVVRKIPEAFSITQVQTKYASRYDEPMNAVLHQEVASFNVLLLTIKASLEELQKSLEGYTVMSKEIEQLSNSLILGKVPAMWLLKSYPNIKSLGGYIADLVERVQFFRDWIVNGLPDVFWINFFFNGQNFLTGVLQNHARRFHIPIDTLEFDFEVTSFEVAPTRQNSEPAIRKAEAGANICGLSLEGARWSQQIQSLDESLAHVLYQMMPVIILKPVDKSSIVHSSTYSCPVYKTAARGRTYFFDIRLPSKQDEQHWIERGVALVGQREF